MGGPGLSEASWPVSVSAGTTSSIAACAQVAKIESDGELEHVEFRSQLIDRNLGLVWAIFGGPHGKSKTTRLARLRSLPYVGIALILLVLIWGVSKLVLRPASDRVQRADNAFARVFNLAPQTTIKADSVVLADIESHQNEVNPLAIKKAPAKPDSPADAIPCLSSLGPLPAARVSQAVADLEPERTV